MAANKWITGVINLLLGIIILDLFLFGVFLRIRSHGIHHLEKTHHIWDNMFLVHFFQASNMQSFKNSRGLYTHYN